MKVRFGSILVRRFASSLLATTRGGATENAIRVSGGTACTGGIQSNPTAAPSRSPGAVLSTTSPSRKSVTICAVEE